MLPLSRRVNKSVDYSVSGCNDLCVVLACGA